MYPYVKNAAFYDLKAKGSDNILEFESPTEKAVVQIDSEGLIGKVVHLDKVKNVETIIPAEKAHHIVVGESNWRRNVYHFLKPNREAHLQMRLGITVHDGLGTWSSLPHDFENNLEPGFEELFFYILKGGTQRAFQVGRGVWADNKKVDEVWPVTDRTFSAIPMGYHPVVGEPKVAVSYVWVYLCKKKEWEKI